MKIAVNWSFKYKSTRPCLWKVEDGRIKVPGNLSVDLSFRTCDIANLEKSVKLCTQGRSLTPESKMRSIIYFTYANRVKCRLYIYICISVYFASTFLQWSPTVLHNKYRRTNYPQLGNNGRGILFIFMEHNYYEGVRTMEGTESIKHCKHKKRVKRWFLWKDLIYLAVFAFNVVTD